MCDCLFDLVENKYLVTFDILFIIAITIIHFVFYYQIKKTDLDYIFQAFDSSPLFDFSVDSNCDTNSHVIFHIWEGINDQTKTNIEKIDGKYFCYKKILYKDLLYNGQIMKKEENCPESYNKNCGIIDTLEQQLCIKNEENCPLYDVGLGIPPNYEDYEIKGNIYYNKNIYNSPNKKIIGKLILNEGQPCYGLNEKLWRKFISHEIGEGHLKCELKILNKLNDERYERKGDITYDELYKDNLGSNYNYFDEEELKNNKVSLYKREFLGINKFCDEKKEISEDNYNKLRKNQKMVKVCLLVEVIIIFSVLILSYCSLCLLGCGLRHGGGDGLSYGIFLIFLIICLSLYLVCIICQSVFLGRIIKYDFDYDCSDEITNEILRKENENTKKTIRYTAANLGIDIFFVLFNIIFLLIIYIKKNCNCIINSMSVNNNDINNNINKDIVSKYKSKEEIKEVIVDNKTSNSNENKIDNINNNIVAPYPNPDEPPVAALAFNPDTKFQ